MYMEAFNINVNEHVSHDLSLITCYQLMLLFGRFFSRQILCTSLNLQFNALLMKTEAPWHPLFKYCPLCMNLMVSSLVFRMKDWFVFSSFLWMMPPDLTARPAVSLVKSWVVEKLQVYETGGDLSILWCLCWRTTVCRNKWEAECRFH